MTDKQKIKELREKIRELKRVCKDQAEINKMLVAALIMVGRIKSAKNKNKERLG